jgi:hypothetical protein
MWNCRPAALCALVSAFSIGLVLGAANGADAQTSDLQTCASRYQAAKADNTLNGRAWQDFYASCKAQLSAPAPDAISAEPKSAPVEQAAPAESAETPKNAAVAPEPAAEPPVPTPTGLTGAQPSPPTAKVEKVDAGAREKKCRAKWKVEAAELKKKDPKLTWDKYWKQCGAHP